MDSPLLPQFKGNADIDTTNLLSDMSLSDPLSPSESMRHTSSFPSSKSARSATANSNPRYRQAAEKGDEDSLDKTTHTAGASKPRFSFFPRNDVQGNESASGSIQRRPSQSRSRSISPVKQGAKEPNGERAAFTERVRQSGEREDDEHRIEAGHVQAEDVPVSRSSRMGNAERDERLRESLYELREMNKVFDGFLGALEAARGHNLVCPQCQFVDIFNIRSGRLVVALTDHT